MDPAGDGGGGEESGTDKNTTAGTPLTQHQQHPPPSPLSGCYLLVVLPEPHTAQHKDLILSRLAKGFLSWDKDNCHVDLEKELQALTAQAPEGEEARNGERLIQYATENLVTEVLIHPQTNTLLQCIRNLLASFTKHRHIIHAGYTFGGNGSWILQDGTFSYADFVDAFSEHEVQRVLRAYENSVTVDIHCAGVGEWSTARLSKEPCTRSCQVKVNPDDVLTAGVPAITSFTHYIEQYLVPQTLDQLMEPSDVVGNIRFSHPTLYVFPGGQGDAALFGINGFNMLVDGGFARKACFWDFARHLDRLDAVLVTRINNSNIGGMSSVLRKKKEMHVYPQIGHFFCNLVERRHSNSPDGDKDIDPLVLDLIDMGQEMMVNLRHISLRSHHCYRDPDPINLYHKVGHGTLDMYVLSPSKDSKEVREFLAKWHASDSKLFSGPHKKDSNNLVFPIQNVVSICALLVWQPANPEGTITRILFPGSTPQHKIFEGLDRLKHLEFLKHSTCSAKSLSPSTSLVALKDKPLKKMGLIEREVKKFEAKREKKETSEIKTVRGSDESPQKTISQRISKVEGKTRKVAENKKIESESKKIESDTKDGKKVDETKEGKKIDDMKKKIEKPEKQEGETKKTDVIKAETEKTVNKEQKPKPEPKKKDVKDVKPIVKTIKPEPPKPSAKPIEKKIMKPADKKDVKSSPTTPKKTLNGTATKTEISKTTPRVSMKPITKAPSTAPAKSAKDANNRKVVEQKNIEMAGSVASASKAPKIKPVERKPISRRTKPVSPNKARVPISPAKSTRSTPTTSVKSDKDGVIRKVKGDKGTTDSSTVSTPSGIEPDSVIRLAEKNLTEKSEDMSLDSIESKVLADLKEEREVVEEIEAVLQKAERIEEARKEERFEGDDDITAEATDKKEEDMTEEDVTAEIEDAPKKDSSRKASQELTEEDEYLIVEKEEIYTEDSAQSGEGEQKHFLDEVESEKAKILMEKKMHQDDEAEEKKDEIPEKKLDFAETSAIKREERRASELLSPEHKEQLKEEMKEIIASATEVVQKSEEKDDSGKKDSEDITKEPSSLSPDKLDSSEKKTDTDVKPELDQKELIPEKMEESQEKISTLESGATTTAPTLPEDERITLDDIKEDIDEKHVAEEVKEKVVASKVEEVIPVELPAPVVRQSIPAHQRDSVKTPDEVADLPVHEEVDPKLYAIDGFSKDSKDEKAQSPQDPKGPSTPSAKEQKGVFSFFGKVADKFEKGIDKLTKKKKDSDKDDDKSSSKSSSPKDHKPEAADFEEVDMDKVFQKVGKVHEKAEVFEQVEPIVHDVKMATIKETATFLQEEIQDLRRTSIPDLEAKAVCTTVDDVEAERVIHDDKSPLEEMKNKTSPKQEKKEESEDAEGIEEVEALIKESSKKFKSVKDSLRDSLESLEDKGPKEKGINLADLPPPTDIITDTLTGVAEKLEEIKPSIESVSPISKEPEKVKFSIPEDVELDDEAADEDDDDYHIPDLKEAVRDVGEVLAGTAGIHFEEKPKDVVEIVKKVAEVLKEDDFLSEKALSEIPKKEEEGPSALDTKLIEETKAKVEEPRPSLGDIMPKKVGVTEQLPSQEEVEEMIVSDFVKPLPVYESATGVEVQEEPCMKVIRDTKITSPAREEAPDREEILAMGSGLLSDVNICERMGVCADRELMDVMDAGLEQICTKTILPLKLEDTDTKEEIESSEIGFEQKLSPAKAELVIVTPGSTPSSPKFIEKISDQEVQKALKLDTLLSDHLKQVINQSESVDEIIEEIITSKKQKITTEIIEYIMFIKRISRERIIEIIENVIIRRGIRRESAMDIEDIIKTEVVISPQKRTDVEDYIEKEFVNKGKKITTLIIEEISLLKIIPKDVIMEIIESIIIKRKITKDSVLDVADEKTQEVSSEDVPLQETIVDQKLKSITEVVEKKEVPHIESALDIEDELVEGFVSIPSKDAVTAFISEERRGTHEELAVEARGSPSGKTLSEKDDFEAVEREEYKVSGSIQSPDISRKLSESKTEEEEDSSDVIEADEKFVRETKEKEGKEFELDDIKEVVEEFDVRVRDTEVSEASEVVDATEKYLNEAKEKVVAPMKEFDDKKIQDVDKVISEKESVISSSAAIDERKKSISEKIANRVPLTEEEQEIFDQDPQDAAVRKMFVTASSEDGGHETEICAPGTITFTKTVTPDDSLKDVSTKSTPEKDSLVMDKDSLHSEESSLEKDSISDKSPLQAKEKVSPVDSLDKSPVGTRDSQDLDDSLEKRDELTEKTPEKSLTKEEELKKVMHLDDLKPMELDKSGDISPADSVFSKSPSEKPSIPDQTSISETPDQAKIPFTEEDTIKDLPKLDAEKSLDKSRFTSIVSVKDEEKPIDRSRSTSIISEKEYQRESRTGSIVGEELDLKEGKISDEKQELKIDEDEAAADRSKSPSIAGDKPDDKDIIVEVKSRSASIAGEKPVIDIKHDKESSDPSISPSVAGEKKDLIEEKVSRSSSIVSEKSETKDSLEKSKSPVLSDKSDEKEALDRSKSPSIAGDKPDDKNLFEEVDSKSKTSSITSEKPDLKEVSDRSKSPSIVGDKPSDKDIIVEVKSRSASIAGEKPVIDVKHDQESSDPSISPSVAGDKPDEGDFIEEPLVKSRTASISSEKADHKDVDPSKVASILEDKPSAKEETKEAEVKDKDKDSNQIKSPALSAKPLDKDLIEEKFSISSSIISEKPEIKDILGESKSPVPSDKSDKKESLDRSKSPSTTGDESCEKDLIEESSDKSRKSSITSEKPDAESNKPSAIDIDKSIEKESRDIFKPSSIASDKTIVKSTDQKDTDNRALLDSKDDEPSDRSKSPSIAGDKENEKDFVEFSKSRSSSIVSEKHTPEPLRKSSLLADTKYDEKFEKDQFEYLRSGSLMSDKLDEDSIDRTKSPSSTSDKSDDKDTLERSKSPSIDGDKQDYDGDRGKSRSPSVINEKVDHDKLLEKDELKVDDRDRSRSSSFGSGIVEEKESALETEAVPDVDSKKQSDKEEIRSRSSSIISEQHDEQKLRSRTSSITSVKHDEKELTSTKATPHVDTEKKVDKDEIRSRSSSIVSEKHDDVKPRSRSSSIASVKHDEKELASATSATPLADSEIKFDEDEIRSRSSSIVSEKHFEEKPRSRSSSIASVKHDEKKLTSTTKTAPHVDSEKKLDKDEIRSRSSSITSVTHDEKELTSITKTAPLADSEKTIAEDKIRSRSSSIVSEKHDDQTHRSRTSSIASVKHDEKDLTSTTKTAPHVDSEKMIDKDEIRSRSSSIVSEKHDDEKPRSRSSSIASVKHDFNELSSATTAVPLADSAKKVVKEEIRSRSSSIVSEKHDDLKLRSRSSSIASVKHDEKELASKTEVASNVTVDQKIEKDEIRSRSTSIVSEKHDDQMPRSRTSSIASVKHDEKELTSTTKATSHVDIEKKVEKEEIMSRSSSIVSEKHEDKKTRSRASSIASEIHDEKDLESVTKAASHVDLDNKFEKEEHRSRSSSVVSEKHDDKKPRSRTSSITSDKSDDKELVSAKKVSESFPHSDKSVEQEEIRSRSSSIVSEKHDPRVVNLPRAESPTHDQTPKDRSRSHSLFEGAEKTPLTRSRTGSLFEDKPVEKIHLMEQLSGALEDSIHSTILEEKDEIRSSTEKLPGSRKQSEAEISLSKEPVNYQKDLSESKSQIVPDVEDVSQVDPNERILLENYVAHEFLGKKKKISAQILDEMSVAHSLPKSVIKEIILNMNIPRDIIGFDQEEQFSDSDDDDVLGKLQADTLKNIEKYIIDTYIDKNKKLSLKVVDEIASVNLVSRRIIITIIEQIILVKKLTRQNILDSDILELEKPSVEGIDTIVESQTIEEKSSESKVGDGITAVPDSKRSSLASVKDHEDIKSDLIPHDTEDVADKSLTMEQDVQGLKPISKSPSPEVEESSSRSVFQQSSDLLETQIPEEISISEEKRTEVKSLLIEDYITKGKKITEIFLQEIINRTRVPRYIILEIIDEIIFNKKLSRDSVIDKLLFLEEDDSLERSLLSTPDRKSSGYSTPEIKHYDDKVTKTIPSYVADYESPFHKAFVGGMTEIRTTHITTLSGKSTPDLGGRADTPESTSDVTSTTGTTSQDVTEKKHEMKTIQPDGSSKTDDDDLKTTVLKTTHLTSQFEKTEDLVDLPKTVKQEVVVYEEDPDVLETVTTKTTRTVIIDEGSGETVVTSEIGKPELFTCIISRDGTPQVTSDVVTKVISRETTPEITTDVKRIVTTVTTVTDSNGKVTTMKDVTQTSETLDREELLDKLIDSSQGDKAIKSEVKSQGALKSDKMMKETTATLTSTSGVSTPDVKMFYDSGKSTPDHQEEKLEVLGKTSAERLEHSISPLVRDLVSDERSYSGKSSPDMSLPKDIAYSGSTGKSTPDIPISPLIRDGAHPSGRSTPDKRLEGRSRTSTPEGFRSGEVIRTTITTTRTMSDDGEIITTTKEVTEATNEKGETVVITEKTDVKVDNHLPESIGNVIGELKSADIQRGSSPGSDAMSERDAGPTSPRSDQSSSHSRAATHVWGSSEERHTYSDDEPPSSPLSTTSHVGQSPRHYENQSMTSSFYGELPTTVTKTETSVRFSDPQTETKKLTVEMEFTGGFSEKSDSKKFIDEADLDSDKILLEEKDTKAGTSVASSQDKDDKDKDDPIAGWGSPLGLPSPEPPRKFNLRTLVQRDLKDDKDEFDPIADWGSPLGLPSPKPPRKFNLRSPVQPSSSSCDLSPDSLNFDLHDWGEPLKLPTPIPLPNEVSNKASPATPKKERKQTKKVISENIKNKKRSESPIKNEKKLKDSKNKVQPVYMDLTYVPHHGNSYYTALEFFKRVRARYYVFSGTEPSREVYDALLEAKKTWEDKDLEVTMIPTYDTDTLGYWVADNEEALAAHHIDLSPSASRCTINLQDHETSCSAYRLEF
ncbi:microtubule-associated protein futsch [Leptopilina boulardi]|uniref:microtubule-associated protein futsch n=1 Tax=Leptopilina boulardi TaxID=63433 RepID=UPI0021F5E889|nr:microtubule-associated protein futsch [Leptopilina boulardi]